MPPAATVEPCIDCDVHPYDSPAHPIAPYLSRAVREAIAQGCGARPTMGYQNPFGVIRRDAGESDPQSIGRELLDRYQIAYAVLQPPGMSAGLSTQIDVGTAQARAWNDWQRGEFLAADPRFLGSICVNMNDPAGAVGEIERLAGDARMVQVLACGESDRLYGHRCYHAIYAACAAAGKPFALHPGTEGSITPSTPVGRPSSYFEWHCGIPQTFQAHLISLVLEGVFARWPAFRLVLVEGGVAWLPHLLWRMDKNFKALRSTTPWLKRPPSEYVFEQVRLTTQPFEEPPCEEHLLAIWEMIHAEQTLMFSSDYPHWDFDDLERAFPRRASAAVRRRVLYENAAELYHLPALNVARPTAPAVEAAGRSAEAGALQV
ncbi:MAG: amidohydrolase family protein [Planctomycetota bacterium]